MFGTYTSMFEWPANKGTVEKQGSSNKEVQKKIDRKTFILDKTDQLNI